MLSLILEIPVAGSAISQKSRIAATPAAPELAAAATLSAEIPPRARTGIFTAAEASVRGQSPRGFPNLDFEGDLKTGPKVA